jgi:hypothetical protein
MTLPPEKSKDAPMHGQGLEHSSPRSQHPISGVARLVPLFFSLSGDTSVVSEDAVTLSRIRSAEGIAWRADASRICLELPDRRATLGHNLPRSVELSSLLGHAVRITLVEETTQAGMPSQTLTLSGASGQVWLIARLGPVRGVVHTIGGAEVHAALSQRPDGPLVVGTRQLQGLAYPGGHVWLPGSHGSVVAVLLARVSSDTAAYVLADDGIYSG